MKQTRISQILGIKLNTCTFFIILLFQLQSSHGLDINFPSFSHNEDSEKTQRNFYSMVMTSSGRLVIENVLLTSNDIPSWTSLGVMSSVFAMSPLFVLPLLWFLQDLPLSKQCIMNTLYQDVIRTNLLIVLIWTFSGLTFKILSENYMTDHLEGFVEFAAVANEAVYFLIMLYMCLIGSLRLYRAKFNVLDPLSDIFGTNEKRIIMAIRIILLSLTLLIIVAIFKTSTKPPAYFQILRSNSNMNNLPISSLLLFLFDVGICTIVTTLHIFGKMYQKSIDSRLVNDLLDLEVQLNRNIGRTGSSVDNHGEDLILPVAQNEGFMLHQQTLPILIYMTNSMTIMILLLIRCFDVDGLIKIDFWWSLTAFICNQGLFIPTSFMIWHPAIRSYCRRQLTCFGNSLAAWFTNSSRKMKRRNLRRVNLASNEELELT